MDGKGLVGAFPVGKRTKMKMITTVPLEKYAHLLMYIVLSCMIGKSNILYQCSRNLIVIKL